MKKNPYSFEIFFKHPTPTTLKTNTSLLKNNLKLFHDKKTAIIYIQHPIFTYNLLSYKKKRVYLREFLKATMITNSFTYLRLSVVVILSD